MVLTGLVSRLVILAAGVLYPAYCSFKAVKNKDHREYTTWMMYWIVFALFLSIETVSDIFLSWLPFYYEIKIVIVLWLALPYTEGAKTLYRRLIHGILVQREGLIDYALRNIGQVFFGIVRKISSLLVNHASEGIATAAMRISRQEDSPYIISPQPEQPLVVRETLQKDDDVYLGDNDFVQVTVDDQFTSPSHYDKKE